MIIETSSKVRLGKPTDKEGRITVELILEGLSSGKSYQELLFAYPKLTEESIRTALAFAADAIEGKC